jgi:hypothetical protein
MANIWDMLKNTGSDGWDAIVDFITTDGGNSFDLEKILPLVLAGVGQSQGWWDSDQKKIGYQGKIPDYTAVRAPVTIDQSPNRMPGQTGQRYLSDIQYALPKNDGIATAQATTAQQALDLAAANAANLEATRPLYNQLGSRYSANRAPLFEPKETPTPFARGGIVDALAQLRNGGTAAQDIESQWRSGPQVGGKQVHQRLPQRPQQASPSGMAPPMPNRPPMNITPGIRPEGRPMEERGEPQMPQMPPQAQGAPQRPNLPPGLLQRLQQMRGQAQPPRPFAEGGPVAGTGITGLPMQRPMTMTPQMPPQAQGVPQRPMTPPGLTRGPGDGMSDSIPAMIQGGQPARLGDGEFVIPADAVSHLGNGSTNAGATQLQQMIDRVRQARTGQPTQGRRINPSKYMPR